MALAPVYCGVSISRLDLLQAPSSVQSRRVGIFLKASSKGPRGAFAASNMGHHQYTSSEETKDSVMELLKNSGSDPLFSFPAGDTQKGNLADKFKMLRQKLRDLDTHHDTMYHSSIASRLAMDRS